jgi:hypothetical protein
MKITVREKSQKIPMIVEGAEKSVSGNSATLSREAKSFEGHVVAEPAEESFLSWKIHPELLVLFEIIVLGIIISRNGSRQVSARFFCEDYNIVKGYNYEYKNYCGSQLGR